MMCLKVKLYHNCNNLITLLGNYVISNYVLTWSGGVHVSVTQRTMPAGASAFVRVTQAELVKVLRLDKYGLGRHGPVPVTAVRYNSLL